MIKKKNEIKMRILEKIFIFVKKKKKICIIKIYPKLFYFFF
jgi:hypothetical protein